MHAVAGGRATVVIADDHAPVRLAVRMALQDSDFDVVGEAATAAAAVAEALRTHPDLVLLDVHMPGNGISAARTLRGELPSAAVVMLTVSRMDDDLFEALRAGARGYLLKDINPDRLADALRGVLAGEAALPRDLATRLIDEFRGTPPVTPHPDPAEPLTAREWQVLEAMSRGRRTQEIAAELFIAPVTVRTHVAAVLRKLKVDTRDEAVRHLLG